MSEITRHIGDRIRLYRKNKRMTLEQFAALLHKSKSTVSKYECGEISIDIETLYEIAAALQINIRQLLDREFGCPASTLMPRGFFSKGSRFYIYYNNKNSSRIVPGVLELSLECDNTYSSVFYADVKDYDNLYQCRHLYYGDIHYSDSFVNLVMQNQDNAAERIFFNIANTFGQGTVTVGMLSATSSKYMIPISLKAIISQNVLPQDEALRTALQFTREDISLMRKAHCFTVDRLFEQFND